MFLQLKQLNVSFVVNYYCSTKTDHKLIVTKNEYDYEQFMMTNLLTMVTWCEYFRISTHKKTKL